ncbi:MAG: OsmC family protein [Vicinamibacteria bacterium]|nr:OsmC family protein [Vicinamibacteria bacterium]
MAGLTLDVRWRGEGLVFDGRSGERTIVLDGNDTVSVSPVEAVAHGLAGCMAIDVVDILQKGRLPLRGLSARLEAERAPAPPKRITSIKLHFTVEGDVPADRVERAIELSHETYCSVWHSLRQDIAFECTFTVVP